MPCELNTRKAAVTDRALRYRAQQCPPAGPRACALCGSKRFLVVDHRDGYEEHTARSNLRWLCKSCNTRLGAEMAKQGKGRRTKQYNAGAVKGARTLAEYSEAAATHTRGAHDAGGAIIHATPKSKRQEFASQIWAARHSRGTDGRNNPPMNPKAKPYFAKAEKLEADAAHGEAIGGSPKVIADLRERAKAFRDKGREVAARPNPAGDKADLAYAAFHGHESEEDVLLDVDTVEHGKLAGLGELIALAVKPAAGGPSLRLEGFDGALLACDSDMRQLYVVGGDQSIDLAEFGINNPHERELLGVLTGVKYYTTKSHLGNQGGTAEYHHTFGEESGVRPALVYDCLNERLEIVGGNYTIEPEGVRD